MRPDGTAHAGAPVPKIAAKTRLPPTVAACRAAFGPARPGQAWFCPQRRGQLTVSDVQTGTVTTKVPARLDRLPWSRWHRMIVIGLGLGRPGDTRDGVGCAPPGREDS